VGIVVGVIDEKGTRFISHGWADADGKSAANADTVFELGSITKVFTSLLLEDMVKRGEMKLDDPISNTCQDVKAPTRNGKESPGDWRRILRGCQLPDNLTPLDAANPYADYTVDKLYDFLGRCTLTRDIGEKYEYSNLGWDCWDISSRSNRNKLRGAGVGTHLRAAGHDEHANHIDARNESAPGDRSR